VTTTTLQWSADNRDYTHSPALLLAGMIHGEKHIAVRKAYMALLYMSFLSSNGKWVLRLRTAIRYLSLMFRVISGN
jgi:hypothetical protein